MPDSRHRRTLRTPSALRLLPRPRPRPLRYAHNIPSPTTSQSSPDSNDTTRNRITTSREDSLGRDIRVQSLEAGTSERHVLERERECNSLPEAIGAATVKRERRNAGRFSTIQVDQCQQLEEGHDVEEEDQTCNSPEEIQICPTPGEAQIRDKLDQERWEEEKSAVMDHMVAELVEIRDIYRGQQEAMDRLIAAMERQSARMERQMDEWRMREGSGRREPRAVEVLIFGVLDVVAMVVLCLVTWCVGKPLGWGRRALRWALGQRGPEGKRRCSWRMSWRGPAVSDDPFLASAARRLSFSTAADLQN